VDAVPDREFNAHIAQISALAKTDFSTWPPPRNFDVTCNWILKTPAFVPA